MEPLNVSSGREGAPNHCEKHDEVIADLERRRARVLGELHPVLRARVVALLAELGGRFVPYCGYRDAAAQAKALREGHSNARFGASPHNYRPALACDVVLNPAVVEVSPVKGAEAWPNLWDDESPDAVKAWDALEARAKLHRLDRVYLTVDGERKRDKPHLQMPLWRIYTKG